MGAIVNGYDLSKVFKDYKSQDYHSCFLHDVHEWIITEKGNDSYKKEWFFCHLFDKDKGFIDELIKNIILWRLREEKQEEITFKKIELEKELREADAK